VSTPPQLASRELLPYLPNGQEAVLPDFGHVGSFYYQQPEAGTRLVNTFFDSGAVDTSRYSSQPLDFTPPTTHGAYARIILTALLGLAAVTVLSLAALAIRLRTRGRVGPVAAATLRSVFPVVLGLGGWAVAALLVLTFLPGVRITNQLVVVASVAAPIWLGIHWSWVHRGWPTPTRRTGGAAAATGALAGAWFGLHATSVPLALLTTIAGAAAGANLALILFDLRRVRAGRPPQAAVVDGEPKPIPP
jgi:hypothetical protein